MSFIKSWRLGWAERVTYMKEEKYVQNFYRKLWMEETNLETWGRGWRKDNINIDLIEIMYESLDWIELPLYRAQ
jgi:hypothetical protein